jgi:hypothetical protein
VVDPDDFGGGHAATMPRFRRARQGAPLPAYSTGMSKGWLPDPPPRADGREPTIADRVAAIVAAWDEGLVTSAEVGSKIIDLLTPATIDEVVAATPAPWRDDVVDRLRGIDEFEGPLLYIIGGVQVHAWQREADPVRRAEMKAEHERQEAAEAAEFEEKMRPAIRAWLRKTSGTEPPG